MKKNIADFLSFLGSLAIAFVLASAIYFCFWLVLNPPICNFVAR